MARKSNVIYWEQVIADQRNSGLTQSTWCEQNDVNIHNFRYWKNRLKHDENSNHPSSKPTWTLVTASSATTTIKPSEFESGQIDIQVGKVKMTLRNSVAPNLLSDVLEVLMHYV